MLKTILDFILSMAHLFFRRKKGKKQFCKKCGALVGRNGICSCGNNTNGSGPGSNRGDHGNSQSEDAPAEPAEPKAALKIDRETETALTPVADFTTRLIGWAMMGVAIWQMVS